MIGNQGLYAFARQGLQLPNADRELARDEVVAIGSCLQLSVAGAAMMEQWLDSSDGQEAVFQALKGLKERGVITVPAGVRLSHRKQLPLRRVLFPRLYHLWKPGTFYFPPQISFRDSSE